MKNKEDINSMQKSPTKKNIVKNMFSKCSLTIFVIQQHSHYSTHTDILHTNRVYKDLAILKYPLSFQYFAKYHIGIFLFTDLDQ